MFGKKSTFVPRAEYIDLLRQLAEVEGQRAIIRAIEAATHERDIEIAVAAAFATKKIDETEAASLREIARSGTFREAFAAMQQCLGVARPPVRAALERD